MIYTKGATSGHHSGTRRKWNYQYWTFLYTFGIHRWKFWPRKCLFMDIYWTSIEMSQNKPAAKEGLVTPVPGGISPDDTDVYKYVVC
jgi:hypothetical protein